MNSIFGVGLLHKLAYLYGVQTAYYDANHHRHQASAEALLTILRLLGASVGTFHDVPSAWREQRQKLWQQSLQPVTVSWDGEPLTIQVRLPSTAAEAIFSGQLTLETGERQSLEWWGSKLPVTRAEEVGGIQYVVKNLTLPGRRPWGYHRLTLEVAGTLAETLIIAAPAKAYIPSERVRERMWGVFLPLYALHSEKSYGSGDSSDLEALMGWVAELGGNVVATLPLLASFLDEKFVPSPYSPSSRLLWNELYLDITKVPELQECPPAQVLLGSSPFQEEIKTLRRLPLVDYNRQIALKRRVLEELSHFFFAHATERLKALRRFAGAHPVVEDYACFQATCESRGSSWQSWPEPLREGVLSEGDYSEETKRYHLYVQWLAHHQLKDLSKIAHDKEILLYLDLPLGVNPNGYDVWRERNVFAIGVSTGAPPDAVFTKGQNWGFPPLHPEKIRGQGYRYTIACLQNNLRYAGILRIDHIMNLHRLYWIPNGLDAGQGVYVRYRAEELYAILTLESCRNKVILVGEDLGTVPPEVRPAMTQHGLQRMYVIHYELISSPQTAPRRPPPNSVASLNTHDMPPFASLWQSLDIKERLTLGLLDRSTARLERKTRRAIRETVVNYFYRKGWTKEATPDAQAVLRACIAFLSASPARVVLVNLEDLWLETQPQNVPGTIGSYPNWRRKARYSLEEFCQMSQVLDTLWEADHLRKREGQPQ